MERTVKLWRTNKISKYRLDMRCAVSTYKIMLEEGEEREYILEKSNDLLNKIDENYSLLLDLAKSSFIYRFCKKVGLLDADKKTLNALGIEV